MDYIDLSEEEDGHDLVSQIAGYKAGANHQAASNNQHNQMTHKNHTNQMNQMNQIDQNPVYHLKWPPTSYNMNGLQPSYDHGGTANVNTNMNSFLNEMQNTNSAYNSNSNSSPNDQPLYSTQLNHTNIYPSEQTYINSLKNFNIPDSDIQHVNPEYDFMDSSEYIDNSNILNSSNNQNQSYKANQVSPNTGVLSNGNKINQYKYQSEGQKNDHMNGSNSYNTPNTSNQTQDHIDSYSTLVQSPPIPNSNTVAATDNYDDNVNNTTTKSKVQVNNSDPYARVDNTAKSITRPTDLFPVHRLPSKYWSFIPPNKLSGYATSTKVTRTHIPKSDNFKYDRNLLTCNINNVPVSWDYENGYVNATALFKATNTRFDGLLNIIKQHKAVTDVTRIDKSDLSYWLPMEVLVLFVIHMKNDIFALIPIFGFRKALVKILEEFNVFISPEDQYVSVTPSASNPAPVRASPTVPAPIPVKDSVTGAMLTEKPGSSSNASLKTSTVVPPVSEEEMMIKKLTNGLNKIFGESFDMTKNHTAELGLLIYNMLIQEKMNLQLQPMFLETLLKYFPENSYGKEPDYRIIALKKITEISANSIWSKAGRKGKTFARISKWIRFDYKHENIKALTEIIRVVKLADLSDDILGKDTFQLHKPLKFVNKMKNTEIKKLCSEILKLDQPAAPAVAKLSSTTAASNSTTAKAPLAKKSNATGSSNDTTTNSSLIKAAQPKTSLAGSSAKKPISLNSESSVNKLGSSSGTTNKRPISSLTSGSNASATTPVPNKKANIYVVSAKKSTSADDKKENSNKLIIKDSNADDSSKPEKKTWSFSDYLKRDNTRVSTTTGSSTTTASNATTTSEKTQSSDTTNSGPHLKQAYEVPKDGILRRRYQDSRLANHFDNYQVKAPRTTIDKNGVPVKRSVRWAEEVLREYDEKEIRSSSVTSSTSGQGSPERFSAHKTEIGEGSALAHRQVPDSPELDPDNDEEDDDDANYSPTL